VNLLELGINTIDDEIVVHPWAQVRVRAGVSGPPVGAG